MPEVFSFQAEKNKDKREGAYMKLMKKLTAVLLSVFLAVPMFGIIANAAEGTLMFSDPETQVGETVSVDLVVRTQGEAIGDADITMNYDTTALEFISGDGVEADGSGTLSYFGSGTGSQTELRTTMQFRALKAGETNIEFKAPVVAPIVPFPTPNLLTLSLPRSFIAPLANPVYIEIKSLAIDD